MKRGWSERKLGGGELEINIQDNVCMSSRTLDAYSRRYAQGAAYLSPEHFWF